MGWTHYWERKKEISVNEFKKAVSDCKKTIDLLGISLAGADGTGQPVFTDEAIVFNGTAGSNCEPFVFLRTQLPKPNRDVLFEYCKTEHLPYDLAVQCCLIIIKNYFNESITVSSDGTLDDWFDAISFCSKTLCSGINFKLENK